MMNEEFIRCVYETIVEEGYLSYKELFDNTVTDIHAVTYWKNASELYNSFTETQKIIFGNILKQVIIDTVSHVFGVLDGSSTLSEGDFDINVAINDISTEDELQDTFLAYVEDMEM